MICDIPLIGFPLRNAPFPSIPVNSYMSKTNLFYYISAKDYYLLLFVTVWEHSVSHLVDNWVINNANCWNLPYCETNRDTDRRKPTTITLCQQMAREAQLAIIQYKVACHGIYKLCLPMHKISCAINRINYPSRFIS